MEIKLKQRVIGAVVIFTLLIIFLPMILEDRNEQQYVEQILEPPMPVDYSDKGRDVSRADAQSDTDIDTIKETSLDNARLIATNPVEDGLDTLDNAVIDKIESELKNKKLLDQGNGASSNKTSNTRKPVKKINNNIEESDRLENIKKNKQREYIDKVTTTASSNKSNAIKYNVQDKKDFGQLYSVKVSSFNSNSTAIQTKDKLLAMGLPSYIHKNSGAYNVYVGPEIEFKFVKQLAQRLQSETDFQIEVVTHDSSWITE